MRISKSKYFERSASNSLILEFEADHTDSLFTQGATAVYTGIPMVTLDQSGRLKVRSTGDARMQFNVNVQKYSSKKLRVRFRPSAYTKLCSSPSVAQERGIECSICLEEFNQGETVAETMCGHKFHLDCLRKVENSKCPNCRASLAIV